MSHAARRNKEEFRAFVGLTTGADPDKDKTIHADFNDPDVKGQFMECFKKCNPDLCYDRMVLFFSWRKLNDPGQSLDFRFHIGTHPRS